MIVVNLDVVLARRKMSLSELRKEKGIVGILRDLKTAYQKTGFRDEILLSRKFLFSHTILYEVS